MSVEIRAKIICDGGCGAVIDGPLQVHTTYQDSYNEARRMAQNQRWLIANRKYRWAGEFDMKERPILFSGEMVRAILDGRKTQTRRVVKPQPKDVKPGWYPDRYNNTPEWVFWGPRKSEKSGCCTLPTFQCPYGEPGERLWVRETHIIRAAGKAVIYRADTEPVEAAGLSGMYGGWKPSIFMPRWASRITLQIVSVRVERVKEIIEEDAKAEGIEAQEIHTGLKMWRDYSGPSRVFGPNAIASYQSLWNSLNNKRGFGWDTNPWVWVIEFRRVKV